MAVRDTEISGGGDGLRLGLLRLINMQPLNDNIIGQAVLITGIEGGGPRRGTGGRGLRRGSFRCSLFGDFRGKQVDVALIMAYRVLEKILLHQLMAPGVGAGVDANTQVPYIFDCAAHIMVPIGEGHLIPHLIGQLPLQVHRLPLDRLMGEAVQLLQPEGAEYRRDLVPGHGQPCVEFIQDVHIQADSRSQIIRSIPGLQHHRIIPSGKGLRKPHGKPTVVLTGANPAGDVLLVPVRQQMGDQHLPDVVIDAAQVGGQIEKQVVVAGVQAQQPREVFLALGTKQRDGQGGVPQLHIRQADVRNLKGGIVQIDRIPHLVGRSQGVTGRKVRRADELRDGIPLVGDGLAGQVGDLRLLPLGLGEDGISFVNDLPVEAVAKAGHIKVQPHKIRVPNVLRRPRDRRVSLYHSVFPVGILAGVLIRPVR